MEEQDDLALTPNQQEQIAAYAEQAMNDSRQDVRTLATVLLTVTVCLNRLQAGDPPLTGPEVDEWYDKTIGNAMRQRWMRVKPASENLKRLGVIK
jgi:hypothetical protein